MAKAETKTWTHPRLGQFEWAGDYWAAQVAAPGFDVFRFETGCAKSDPLTGRYELRFQTGKDGTEPSPEAVAVAERIVTQSDATVTLVINALWNDFAGNPPDSGMWWHGDLDGVCEDLDTPPTTASEVAPLMRL